MKPSRPGRALSCGGYRCGGAVTGGRLGKHSRFVIANHSDVGFLPWWFDELVLEDENTVGLDILDTI